MRAKGGGDERGMGGEDGGERCDQGALADWFCDHHHSDLIDSTILIRATAPFYSISRRT